MQAPDRDWPTYGLGSLAANPVTGGDDLLAYTFCRRHINPGAGHSETGSAHQLFPVGLLDAFGAWMRSMKSWSGLVPEPITRAVSPRSKYRNDWVG